MQTLTEAEAYLCACDIAVDLEDMPRVRAITIWRESEADGGALEWLPANSLRELDRPIPKSVIVEAPFDVDAIAAAVCRLTS